MGKENKITLVLHEIVLREIILHKITLHEIIFIQEQIFKARAEMGLKTPFQITPATGTRRKKNT